jgi:C4-dicarboxylate-specific signal transduction histidine kinase
MSGSDEEGREQENRDGAATGVVASIDVRERAAAGALARGISRELVRPLRELREDLAVVVELLDRHMAGARGPKGLPWKEVEALRQQLADSYLRSRRIARLVSELADAIAPVSKARVPIDVNKIVESALNLSRHRIVSDTEVFIDLGSVPLVRGSYGDLLLAVARMIGVAADSASRAESSALSVKTRRERDEETGRDEVVIFVADNGSGRPAAARSVTAVGEHVAAAMGGVFAGTSERGIGSVFELRLPTGQP